MDKYYGIRLAMVVIYNDESDIREENQNIGEQLGLREISSQIPRNSDERISVDSLDQTHRHCARRGAHPRESRVIFRGCCRT
ncbi:hypothetical protein H5410_028632 [Solanum commersonii]|uniref:Uncharacterized protein n=1 Tax=Solanum commersonii TaxID=4109 RepID=A0A9J5Z6P6_SOLCO|nr:hypothetical protein H5410_028632 [Solanum commersonii]